MSDLRPGDRVRFAPAGWARIAQMPEAWGLHTAASREEVGVVVEILPPELPEEVPRVSVEFPSGAAYNWEMECFIRVEEERNSGV